jgi:excisionase family DNA binding protein
VSGEIIVALDPAVTESVAVRAAAIVLERLRQADPVSPYMTVAEAAAYARCKRQRIYDLLSSRRLTRYKDGSRALILRAELEAHLAAKPGPPNLRGPYSISRPDRATVDNLGNR